MSNKCSETKAHIKRTLLELLAKQPFNKITVTTLCKCAYINRGTFYLHYQDLWEVLEELEEDALRDENEQGIYHCSLNSDHYQCPYAICDKIHSHPEYGPIFFDESLATHIIECIAKKSKDKYIVSLTQQLSLTPEQAETIFYFQLNGCLAVNRKIFRDGSKNWQESRDLIGGFIQSGLKRYIK